MKGNRLRIAILISGNGTNLQAISDAIQQNQLPIEIAAVISDNPVAPGLKRAEAYKIPTYLVAKAPHQTKSEYEKTLIAALKNIAPDLIVLAGFMRIVGQPVLEKFSAQFINIHPSLLPKYPGLDTHSQVLQQGDYEHGCSIHFVNEIVDAGPLIAQATIKVRPEDTVETLKQRVHKAEHFLYPTVLNWFAAGRIDLIDHQVHLDGIPLTTGLRFAIG